MCFFKQSLKKEGRRKDLKEKENLHFVYFLNFGFKNKKSSNISTAETHLLSK